jgi:hypothetical protein
MCFTAFPLYIYHIHGIRIIKSIKCTGFCWGNLREGDHWGNPGVDRRIILGWIFGKWDVGVWTG